MTIRTAFAVLAALAVAGCGGGSSGSGQRAIVPTPPVGPGAVPIAPNSSYTTPATSNGDSLVITFNDQVPPGEEITYLGVTPGPVIVPATFYTGAAFSVEPYAMPVSAITGVTLFPGSAPQSSLTAALYQNTPTYLHGVVPFRVAPATAYQLGTDPSPTLTTFSPNAVDSITVSRN
jgi:hypothetical protein